MADDLNPYRSPAPPVLGDQIDDAIPAGKKWAPIRPFRSITGLATFVKTLLLLDLSSGVAGGVLSWMRLLGNDPFETDPFETEAFSPTMAAILLGILLITLLTIVNSVAFLVWFYRCHSNLPALGVARLAMTHGWSVGWWLIPLANWVMPYRATLEIWHGSRLGSAYQGAPAPGSQLLRLWWVVWVVFDAGRFFSLVANMRPVEPEFARALALLDIGLSAVGMVSNLLTWLVVDRVTALQMSKAQKAIAAAQ